MSLWDSMSQFNPEYDPESDHRVCYAIPFHALQLAPTRNVEASIPRRPGPIAGTDLTALQGSVTHQTLVELASTSINLDSETINFPQGLHSSPKRYQA